MYTYIQTILSVVTNFHIDIIVVSIITYDIHITITATATAATIILIISVMYKL